MALETIIDLVLAVLLVAAIGSSYLLHRRIDVFRKGQQELAGLVEQLNQATNQAQASVVEMKSSGTVAEEQLKSQMAKARALADELSLITEAGDSLADRLERRLVGNNSGSSDAAPSPDSEGEGTADEDEDRPAYFSALKEAR